MQGERDTGEHTDNVVGQRPGPNPDNERYQIGKEETMAMIGLTLQRKRGQSQAALYNSTHPSSRSSTTGRGHGCPARCLRRL